MSNSHKNIWYYLLTAVSLLGALPVSAQTQVTSPMTGTPSSGDYFSYTGITLNPGFSFAASAGNSLRLYIANPDCQPLVTALSASQNYIVTSVPRTGGITTAAGLAGRSTCELMQTVQYFDGLGRPLQTVRVMASPVNKDNPSLGNKDIVQPVAYDQFGRETTKYLPYASSGSDGSYKATAIADQLNFYHPAGTAYTAAQLPGGVAHIPTPYSVTAFEASPLNRVTEQGAPGDAWQLTGTVNASGVASGHTMKMDYATNNLTALTDVENSYLAALYTISAINATTQERTLTKGIGTDVNYPAGRLYVTITKDENWVSGSGKGRTTEEYKDMEGHVVLKRTFNKPSATLPLEVLSTYYVYDDLGNLAYVLPPLSGADNSLPNQTTLNTLCYQYRYDERNRLTQKKLPGKDWEYMVYNKLDQVVATQDGLQRSKPTPEWTVTRYDALGRVILTGLYSYGDTRTALQTLANNQTSLWETPTGTSANYGYTAASFPATVNTTLMVNYYDDYRFAGTNTNPYPYTAGSTMPKGLATGSLTNVLGTTNMLWTVNYYDDQGRNIKIYKQHYLGGTISVNNYDEISIQYNFTNQDTAVTRKHYTKNAGSTAAVLAVTIGNSYEYDHMGRKINTFEKINTGDKVLLSQNEYNQVGQLKTKHLHRQTESSPFLQDIDYAYNERGWLSMINNPAVAPTTSKLFSEQLNYNVPQYTATPQFNGNIAEQAYRIYNSPASGIQTVKYAYDQLNRLTDGTNSTGLSETGISYDMAGNIKALNRATAPNAATLSYLYSGNQLTSVTKSGAPFRSYGYDQNGNATSDGQGNTINYNILNLPQSILSKSLTFTYDAAGSKLRKVSGTNITEYISGIQYNGTTIEFIQTEEGRVLNPTTSPNYEYTLADHLGNNRVTFDQVSNKVGEDDYYPFGLSFHRGTITSPQNKYLYNKKELQDELGQYDYGARFYDPVIARMTVMDAYAEQYVALSPYQYGALNPAKNIDVNGDSIKVNIIWTLDLSIIGGGTSVKTTSLYFQGGDAYMKNGTKYTGTDAFVASVSSALKDIAGGADGNNLLSHLESLTQITTIYQRKGNETEPKNGSYVFWNPSLTAGPPDQSGNTPNRPAFIGLAHELAHVEDIWQGPKFTGIWYSGPDENGNNNDVMNAEKYATYRENQIRSEHNIPLRTYYSPDGSGGVYTPSRIIDRKGNNLWIRTIEPPLVPARPAPFIIPPSTIPNRPLRP